MEKVVQGLRPKEYLDSLSLKKRTVFETIIKIAEAVKEMGGRALLVGGSVRDEVLGIDPKDFDVEVYGLEPERVEKIVAHFGSVKDVGKAFGILKLHIDGTDLDVSLPRVDSKSGEGHRGFDVEVDPEMTIEEAIKRRDFTINALLKDPLTGEIIDVVGGIDDIQNRVLRVTNTDLFGDDPLRLLRAAQLVGRFSLSFDDESLKALRAMVLRLKEISKDRIREEWDKLILSPKPERGLDLLRRVGAIDEYYPELIDTVEVQSFHLEDDQRRVVVLSMLCKKMSESDAKRFLKKIGVRQGVLKKVLNILNEIELGSLGSSDGELRQMSLRLKPATIEEFSYVVSGEKLRERAEKMGILHKVPESLVSGKDLIKMGFEESSEFGEFIKLADQCRDLVGLNKPELIKILKDSDGLLANAIVELTDRLQAEVNPFED